MLDGNKHHLRNSVNLSRAFLLASFYYHGRIRYHAKESVDESLSFFDPSGDNVVTTSIIFHSPKLSSHSPS